MIWLKDVLAAWRVWCADRAHKYPRGSLGFEFWRWTWRQVFRAEAALYVIFPEQP